jgi:hypothetical protein
MVLRQLRSFVRVVELGSMGSAAADLGVVTSALSQQISRLEGAFTRRTGGPGVVRGVVRALVARLQWLGASALTHKRAGLHEA